MDDKSLKDKAVDIKGKQYVLVQDRVLYFNEHYPKGEILTELVSAPDAKHIIVKAFVRPEATVSRVFTGYSQAIIGEGMVNKTAALENAETSAVGRALAFMGIGVIESIASADEIHKATAKASAKPWHAPTVTEKKAAIKKAIDAKIMVPFEEGDGASYIKYVADNFSLDLTNEDELDLILKNLTK